MAVEIRASPAMRAGTAAHSPNNMPDITGRCFDRRQSKMKHLPLVTHLSSLALARYPSSLFICSHVPSVLLLSFLALSPPGHSLSASHR